MKRVVVFLLFIMSSKAFCRFDWLTPPEFSHLYKKEKLSIVFASQNLKSPVSMFGHTFLVAHNEMPPEPDAITIEFVGKTYGDPSNYLKALFYQIEGEFRLSKFILKNREYDFEDRNLWVYQLDISQTERYEIFDFLKLKIESKQFSYTFLNRNCSYYIFNGVIRDDSFRGDSLYTLPKHTIRDLKKRGYIKRPPVLMETDQSKLINFLQLLNNEDRKKIRLSIEGYYYPLAREKWEVQKGLDLALTYKIPREADSKKRTQYFNTKKILAEIQPVIPKNIKQNKYKDPLDAYGDANLRFGYGLHSNSFFVEGKLAQRDFFTSMYDELSSSYLEIAKAKIGIDRAQNIQIKQMTLLKIESLLPGGDYNEPFNSLLDLSYYQNLYKNQLEANESVIRVGQGLSMKKSDFMIGAIPYLGLRYFNFSSRNGHEIDLGILTKLNFWLNENSFFESSLINYINTQMPFNYRINLKFSANISSQWKIGIEGIIFENDTETELSLSHGF